MKSISLQDKPLCEDVHFAVPDLLDDEHGQIRRYLNGQSRMESPNPSKDHASFDAQAEQDYGVTFKCRSQGSWISVTNVHMKSPNTNTSMREEVYYCFNAVKGMLQLQFSPMGSLLINQQTPFLRSWLRSLTSHTLMSLYLTWRYSHKSTTHIKISSAQARHRERVLQRDSQAGHACAWTASPISREILTKGRLCTCRA